MMWTRSEMVASECMLTSQFEKMKRLTKATVSEIEQLSEKNKQQREEINRLRGLLEKALTYSHSMPTTLVAAIEKEVGDEG